MNICTCICRDSLCLAEGQDVMQSTSRIFAKSSRDLAFQKRHCRISSAGRCNRSPSDSFQGNPLNVFDLPFIDEEMNRKGAVAARLPWNVGIQPNKPWKI